MAAATRFASPARVSAWLRVSWAGLAAPALRVERLPENEYFAVLPGRGDAPPAAGLELQELLAAFEAPGKAAAMK